jgi:hypothetical protein
MAVFTSDNPSSPMADKLWAANPKKTLDPKPSAELFCYSALLETFEHQSYNRGDCLLQRSPKGHNSFIPIQLSPNQARIALKN